MIPAWDRGSRPPLYERNSLHSPESFIVRKQTNSNCVLVGGYSEYQCPFQLSWPFPLFATPVPATRSPQKHGEKSENVWRSSSPLWLPVFGMSQRETEEEVAWFTLNQALDHAGVS